jgi:hypothetical protein
LITSSDAQCSYLGTRSSKRFEQGRIHHTTVRQALRNGGRGREAALGYSIPPISRIIHITDQVFPGGNYPDKLTASIVHEEAHIAYYWKYATTPRHGPHDWWNNRDMIFEISNRCSAGAPF